MPMATSYPAIIAVVGTLLGSITTHLLGRRTAAEQAAAARSERLRQEQLAACSAFAGALTELKRPVITLWFRRHESPSEETRATWVEADRLGAAAEAARFRVLMVLDDPSLAGLADDAHASIAPLGQVDEREDLRPAEEAFAAKPHQQRPVGQQRAVRRNRMHLVEPQPTVKQAGRTAVAGRHGVGVDAVAIGAALAQPCCDVVLSGAVTPDQLTSNAASVSFAPGELESLSPLSESPDAYWAARSRRRWT